MSRHEDPADRAIRKRLNPVPWPRRRATAFIAVFALLLIANLVFLIANVIR